MISKKKFELIFIPLTLLILNLVIIFPLFQGDFTQYRESIEPVYITAGKFFYQYFPDFGWNHLWYGGFPMDLLYTPIFPILEAILYFFTNLSFWHIYRILTALNYLLLPVTLYFFLRYLFKSTVGAFITSLGYSLLPSFIYIFDEVRQIGEGFSFAPWRLVVLIYYGEGPHLFSLAILPLAALLFLYSLRNPSYWKIIGASFLISLVALSNLVGFLALFFLLFALFFSEFIRQDTDSVAVTKTAILCLILSLGLVAFWFNVSFIKNYLVFGEVAKIFKNYLKFIFYLPLILPLFLLIIFQIFNKRISWQPVLISILWFLPLLISYFVFTKKGISLIPQPNRYLPEIDLVAMMLFGFLISEVYKKISDTLWFGLGRLIFLIIIILIFINFSFPINKVHNYLKPNIEPIEKSAEYEISQWLKEEVECSRVFVTGNYTFYLNYFTDVSQLRGGFDQAAISPWWDDVAFQLTNGIDGEVALYLAKAMNLCYILVNYPQSRDIYKDYHHPQKFEDYFTRIGEKEGDVLYKTPLKKPSLAQVIDLEKFQRLEEPYNAVDKQRLKDYTDWIDNEAKDTPIQFEWEGKNEALIKTDLKEGEAISLQITYDRGWKGFLNGKKVEIKKDVMGNMVILPKTFGQEEIILKYGKTWDRWLGYGITIFTLILIIFHPRWFKKFFTFEKFQPPRILKPEEYEITWK